MDGGRRLQPSRRRSPKRLALHPIGTAGAGKIRTLVKLRLGELTFDADARQLLRSGAEIHLSPKAFDLGSKNGTYVGGEPVSKAVRLKNGDEIRTGSVVLRFRMTTPAGATATWSGTRKNQNLTFMV